jgi:two-component system, OmpR family, phosphate regulon sensor histidine kinase PhoR
MIVASPMFRKLLLRSLLVILVAVVALDILLTRYTAYHETRNAERQLQAQARILADEVAGLPAAGLAIWTKEANRRTQSRVTLIAHGGTVLTDSEHDAGTMENHAGRPEVREALQGRPGSSVRHSATLDHDLLYLALPVTFQGREGYVLRLAVPLEQVDEAIAEVRWRIFQVSLIAALLSLGVAYVTSRSLSRRIRRLQLFADGLVNARFSETLPPAPEDELGSLARSLNGMSNQLRDMLERLKLEASRREAILAGMVEGVLAVDHELNVTFCNQAFARAVGVRYPASERLPVLELVRDPAFLNLLTRTVVTAEPQRQRMQLSAAEGHSFEVQAAPLEFRSGRGAIAILHDVTDLERLERVRRDFVANVSHELRTPLAAIQGYAETLLDGALEDAEHNRRFLETIKSQAVRLNNIASDLLALSELESIDPGPSPERISLRQAVGAAMRSIESEARLRNIRIHSGGLPDEYAVGQRLRLEQALVNLLDNAVKFNRPGGEVWIEVGSTGEGKVRISVRDNGIGIPSDDLPRIFERFYRVDKARSREVGGTGLGLSIVKHAIEAMGGSVSVESELGKGSHFTIVLPDRKVD